MARSTQEQLDGVDSAITAIEAGAQEYYIGSRRVRRGELSALYKERARLQDAVDTPGGVSFRPVIFDCVGTEDNS